MTKNSSKKTFNKVIWLLLSLISGGLLFFQLLGLVLASFTKISLIYDIFFKYAVALNLLFTILLYAAFKFSRLHYTNLLSKNREVRSNVSKRRHSRFLTKKDLIFTLLITLITLFPYLVHDQKSSTPIKSDTRKTLTQLWEDFTKETAGKTNYTSTPIYEVDHYLGCFDDSGKPKGGYCHFSNDEYYVTEGDYHQFLRDILIHLTNTGYEFRKNFLGGDKLEDYTDSYIEKAYQDKYLSVLLKNEELDRTILIDFSSKDKLKNSLIPKPPPQSVIESIQGDPVIYRVLYQQDFN